jgi:lycopene beta-cyclase
VNEIAYRCDWVFDSRYRADAYRLLTHRYHYLIQHFLGWEIETEKSAFDPRTPTLFDFRTPQQGTMRFFYILPFSERRALVEYTVFSDALLPKATYRHALCSFLERQLGLSEYRILEEEHDLIPMSDHPYPRRAGPRVLNIGTRGGRVKPSSGYAFRRIQEDAAAITRSLATRGHPFDLPKPPARYRTFDAMLLQILHRHGELGEPVFMRLFRRNPIDRVFRFLDEEDNLWQNLKLMATVPPGPFIRAWIRVKLLRRA